jgi:hypothetical protein
MCVRVAHLGLQRPHPHPRKAWPWRARGSKVLFGPRAPVRMAVSAGDCKATVQFAFPTCKGRRTLAFFPKTRHAVPHQDPPRLFLCPCSPRPRRAFQLHSGMPLTHCLARCRLRLCAAVHAAGHQAPAASRTDWPAHAPFGHQPVALVAPSCALLRLGCGRLERLQCLDCASCSPLGARCTACRVNGILHTRQSVSIRGRQLCYSSSNKAKAPCAGWQQLGQCPVSAA